MKYNFSEILDYQKYKKENPYYCEVLISPSGKIYEAIPSHEYMLCYILAKRKKMTYEEFYEWSFENCTLIEKLNWLDYLIKQTHWVPVWTHWYKGFPNNRQKNALLKLKRKGIYLGKV